MDVYVGVDIGTGGVRAVALSSDLEVVQEAEASYKMEAPESGWAQQDPDAIVDATLRVMTTIAEKLADDEIVFSFSSVMHSLLAVGPADSPISPMLIWADNRAIRETKWLEREYGAEMFYRSTACPLHPSFWPGKIIWLNRELGPSRIARFVSIKEYLVYRLTGEWLVDMSVAGSSGLFDLTSGEFDSELLDALRIDKRKLSQPVATTHTVEADIAGTRHTVVLGSTDGVLANLGIGAVSPDTGVLTAGSSAAVRITCPEPIFDPQRRTWCYRLDDDHYVVGEASNSGGLVLNWFARILGYDSASAMSDELVPDPPYDPVDALLLPTLSGERAPGYQEELRGELIDLALSTTRQDLVIATMEGIGLFCRFIFDDLNRATGAPPHRTILTGQLGRSRPFGNLAPFLFGSCSTRKEMDQSSAVGAAMLGIKATAGVDYKEILSRLPQLEDVEAISSAPFARYLDEKYVRFKEAYEVASSRIKAVEPLGPEG